MQNKVKLKSAKTENSITSYLCAAGPLQLCAGHEAGCETAIHAATLMFEDEGSEGVLLVDADNAFNRLNREATLWNIQYICPTLSTIVVNCYRTPARLFVMGGLELSSCEGTTQVDPLAMAMYAIAISPLLSDLTGLARHVWFADDAQAVGKICNLRAWWDVLLSNGPKYGYFPKPSKTKLVVKHTALELAQSFFLDSGIEVVSGARDLGSFIGSGTTDFIEGKVDVWCSEILNLAKIAESEPHAAHAAFIHGVRHKWSFLQRTLPDMDQHLGKLESILRDKYIPSLLGRPVSDSERELLALPASFGGAAIDNPVKDSAHKFNASKLITNALNELVNSQSVSAAPPDTHHAKKEVLHATKNRHKLAAEVLKESLPMEQARAMAFAQCKGASALITAKPIDMHGFHLAKRDFRDALLLRYGWPVPELPITCVCGQANGIDHSQTCNVGGFIHMRHDNIRDLISHQMKEVFRDVEVEPPLTPLNGEVLEPRTANTADDARADIRVNGFWTRQQGAYFDVRVFYPNAPSYRGNSLDSLLNRFEAEKKRHYNDRVIQVERGTFTPLVFSSGGAMGRETSSAIKKLCMAIAEKRCEPYSVVKGLMGCRLSFSLIRASIACLRGSRHRVIRFADDNAVVVAQDTAFNHN
jgi:hypothetical protein